MFPLVATHPVAESELSKFYNSDAMLANAALYEQERTYQDEIYQQFIDYRKIMLHPMQQCPAAQRTRPER